MTRINHLREQERSLQIGKLLLQRKFMNSLYPVLDNRVRSCRNYRQVPIKYENNICNNSSDLSKKCAAMSSGSVCAEGKG